MREHLRCGCGHIRRLHGDGNDTECRICRRVWGSDCYRFRWRWFARLHTLASSVH